MSSERSFFTLVLPRRPRDGDKIQIVAKLKNKPKLFRLLLGVKSVPDTRTNFEPKMIAFQFKTEFNENGEPRVTTNWKTQEKWQSEKEVDETDWLDEQSGLFDLNIEFKGSSTLLLFDEGGSLISNFKLQYDINSIDSVMLYGDILKLDTVSLKYDQKL